MTSNLAIAKRSHVSSAHKVTTVSLPPERKRMGRRWRQLLRCSRQHKFQDWDSFAPRNFADVYWEN